MPVLRVEMPMKFEFFLYRRMFLIMGGFFFNKKI